MMRGISGTVVMLNLLRFRAVADYSTALHLAPAHPISGAEAYDLYVQHTLPFLRRSGGEVVFYRDYLDGLAHRAAAIEDARLLPLVERQVTGVSTVSAR